MYYDATCQRKTTKYSTWPISLREPCLFLAHPLSSRKKFVRKLGTIIRRLHEKLKYPRGNSFTVTKKWHLHFNISASVYAVGAIAKQERCLEKDGKKSTRGQCFTNPQLKRPELRYFSYDKERFHDCYDMISLWLRWISLDFHRELTQLRITSSTSSIRKDWKNLKVHFQ